MTTLITERLALTPVAVGDYAELTALSAAPASCDESVNAPHTVCMISPYNAPSLALAESAGYRAYAPTDDRGERVTLLVRGLR